MNRLVQVFSFPTNFEFALNVPTEINIQNLSQSFDAFFFNHKSSRKVAAGCTVSYLCHCNVRLQ